MNRGGNQLETKGLIQAGVVTSQKLKVNMSRGGNQLETKGLIQAGIVASWKLKG